MPPTRPLKVFLCHASADKPAVRKLYQRLASENWIDPWLDEEKLSLGQHWTTVIEDALDAADIVLIFLSSNSVQKEGFVQRELNYAWELSLEKPIETIFLIPFRLDDCEVPRRLRSRQWGDYFGDKEESTYQILLRALKQRHEQKLRLEAEEQKQRDAIEKAAREKAKHEATEKLAHAKEEQEIADKIAHEKTERETTEKATREKLEQDSAEKLAREKKEQENAERIARLKAARENAEKIAHKRANREAAQKKQVAKPFQPKSEPIFTQRKQAEQKLPVTNQFPIWFGVLGLLFIVIVSLIITSMWNSANSLQSRTPTSVPFIIPTGPLDIGSSMISPKDGMKLLYVPAGNFLMGSTDADTIAIGNEKPQHSVTLDAFWIDLTEVTNKQYAACVFAKACSPPSNTKSYTRSSYYGNSEFDDYPVIYVSWDQATAYCSWVGRRLPTEAEWEKAARGTDGRIYPWGNDAPNNNLLNYNSINDTTKVGGYLPGKSFYGAYDMAGNVSEWVNDWYQSDYYATLGDHASNPQGPSSGDGRVLRGGSWNVYNDDVRSASRIKWLYPTLTDSTDGFRCAQSATP